MPASASRWINAGKSVMRAGGRRDAQCVGELRERDEVLDALRGRASQTFADQRPVDVAFVRFDRRIRLERRIVTARRGHGPNCSIVTLSRRYPHHAFVADPLLSCLSAGDAASRNSMFS